MTWNLLIKLLKLGMLNFLIAFLMGCQSLEKSPTKTENQLKVNWHFHELVPNELMGCLSLEDVKSLRRQLIMCEDMIR